MLKFQMQIAKGVPKSTSFWEFVCIEHSKDHSSACEKYYLYIQIVKIKVSGALVHPSGSTRGEWIMRKIWTLLHVICFLQH